MFCNQRNNQPKCLASTGQLLAKFRRKKHNNPEKLDEEDEKITRPCEIGIRVMVTGKLQPWILHILNNHTLSDTRFIHQLGQAQTTIFSRTQKNDGLTPATKIINPLIPVVQQNSNMIFPILAIEK